MEFVPALTPSRYEAGAFQDVDVLRDRLAGRAHLMFHREARADLKERLAVSCAELIEDCPPGRVRQSLEDIAQTKQIIGKQLLACQLVSDGPVLHCTLTSGTSD